jgi:outer membrane receptor for ferric coprogen and ferric-rhodotorulic acid
MFACYCGMVYDLSSRFSAFASYSTIFKPQSH